MREHGRSSGGERGVENDVNIVLIYGNFKLEKTHTGGRHRQSSEVAIRTWDRSKAYHCLQSPPTVGEVVTDTFAPVTSYIVDNDCDSKMQLHQKVGPCKKDTA